MSLKDKPVQAKKKFRNRRIRNEVVTASLRLIYAEPRGYHQGALLSGYRPVDDQLKKLIRREKAKSHEKLLAAL